MVVYRNLNKACWSLKDTMSGKVTGHAESVVLSAVTFKVSEAGRQQVLKAKQRRVHAWCIGAQVDQPKRGSWVRVKYNPYNAATFVVADTDEPVTSASFARFDANGSCWIIK